MAAVIENEERNIRWLLFNEVPFCSLTIVPIEMPFFYREEDNDVVAISFSLNFNWKNT